jgi:anti-sigma regulatory factor (Ser/Thr protein kinase)
MGLDIPLALTEALANAVVHGSSLDSSKRVLVSIKASRNVFSCAITDEGPGFDHTSAPEFSATDDYPLTHGRGIFLIKNLMSRVSFNPAGNQIRMRLVLPHEA